MFVIAIDDHRIYQDMLFLEGVDQLHALGLVSHTCVVVHLVGLDIVSADGNYNLQLVAELFKKGKFNIRIVARQDA